MKGSRLLATSAVVGGAVGGFLIPPPVLAPPRGSSHAVDRSPLPRGLPPPLEAFYRSGYGESLPVTTSVSLWGRVRLRMGPAWLHGTMRSHHLLGRDFVNRFEATWYGIPVLRGAESYAGRHGHSRAFNMIESGPHIDQATALMMWSEAFLFPYGIVAQPAAQWESVSEEKARLKVPAGDGVASALVSFDLPSRRPVRFRAFRFKDAEHRVGWTVAYTDWRRYGGLLIPGTASVSWDDQRKPWMFVSIEGAAANLDEPFGTFAP